MLKQPKLDYQRELEDYMETNKVYDIFESMMKELIIELPQDPVKFILDKIGDDGEPMQKVSRIVIMGPPGSKRKEHALALSDHFQHESVSVGDLLNREINKKTPLGQRIHDSRKRHQYVEDEIAIELVMKQIDEFEKEKKSWIIEGFPRTREQALELAKRNFILDKFVLIDVDDSTTLDRLSDTLKSEEEGGLTDMGEILRLSQRAIKEYKYHIEGVKEIIQGNNISVVDASGKRDQQVVLEDIARLLKLKPAQHIPKRAPRILLCGPPGSGRTLQAAKIAEKYQLVHVASMEKNEINKKTEEGKRLRAAIKKGQSIPDDILGPAIKERIDKEDCQINGWIMEGFPASKSQIALLLGMGVDPSHVIILEINDSKIYERLEHRRYDSLTGIAYNTQVEEPEDAAVVK